jgi:hypothetical protein
MRSLLFACLATVLVLPGVAHAQAKPKLQIADVRIGFPAGVGRETGERLQHFKAGSWTPVYVDVQASREGLKGTEGHLDIVVETSDSDDVLTNYSVPIALAPLGPNEMFTVLTYAKLANNSDQITVSMRYKDEPLGQSFKKQQVGLDSGQVLYLTIGSRLQNLGQGRNEGELVDMNVIWPDMREHVASIDTISQMPPHWFGYDGVDVVVLATGNKDFLKGLESADPRYLQALTDWVKRGGHLVISVGQNHDAFKAKAFTELGQLLPAEFTRADKVPKLRLVWEEGNFPVLEPFPEKSPDCTVAIMELKNDQNVVPVMRRAGEGGLRSGQVLIAQGSAGMGRVTVVGFDLDQRPFTDWKGRRDFWRVLMTQAWARTAALGIREEDPNQPRFGPGENTNQLGSHLYAYLENFEEVPVISFGWVAMFIVLYILIVGPLDYFFLKKVVKRLELTWITFPTVVLTISAIAYFTAYYVKGKDLRIRKVDVLDVDMTGSQPIVVGNTWFTLFSPRIQHYTIGIDPATEWVPEAAAGDARAANTVVSWLGRPETDRMYSRNRGQSLFRRAYDYEPAATGLKGVPIQVWSTKSFASSWQTVGDPNKSLFASSLKEVKRDNGSFLTGEITWLPGGGKEGAKDSSLDLKEVCLLYNNRVVNLTLSPGKATAIKTEDEPRQDTSAWFRSTLQQGNLQPDDWNGPRSKSRRYQQQGFTNLDYPIRAAMFFETLDRGTGGDQNNNLRLLDQSYRLKHPGEAILLVRMPVQQGPADTTGKHMACTSRLWLGKLPTPGEKPPDLDGILRQDTYLRVYLPVQTKD